MTTYSMYRSMILSATTLLAAGCVSPTPGAEVHTGWIGTGPVGPSAKEELGIVVDVQGTNAFVEIDGTTMPATKGKRLSSGDRFFTGNASRMTILLTGGGYVELDEETDPGIVRQAGCMAIRLFRLGRIFVEGQRLCVESEGNALLQHSKVAYRVIQPNILRITPVEGQVESLRPQGYTVTPGYQLELQGGEARRGGAYEVTTSQVLQEVGWTTYYRRYRPSLPGFDRLESPPPPPPVVQ